jgi:S1-C subfamily serine protease
LVAAAAATGAGAAVSAGIRARDTEIVKFSPNTSVFGPMKAVKAVLARVLPSVVTIQALGPGCTGALSGTTQLEEGTGIVLTRGGEILTNNHVIAEASQIKVTLYGQKGTYPATLVGTDPGEDVALLQLHGPARLQAVSLGGGARPRVGDLVLAIGNALALSQSKPSVTEGIISAEGRSIKAGGGLCAGTESLKGLLQTQAAINSGNSGGPLVDTAGEVIGMSTAAAATTPGNAPTQNIGFAIPVGSIKRLLPGLRRGGTAGPPKAFLGVEVVSVTASNRASYGLYPTRGALVVGLFPGAPAALAGIRVGDVIVDFGGRPIPTDVALTVATRSVHPGTRVSIELYQGPLLRTVSLVLGTKPAPEPGAG